MDKIFLDTLKCLLLFSFFFQNKWIFRHIKKSPKMWEEKLKNCHIILGRYKIKAHDPITSRTCNIFRKFSWKNCFKTSPICFLKARKIFNDFLKNILTSEKPKTRLTLENENGNFVHTKNVDSSHFTTRVSRTLARTKSLWLYRTKSRPGSPHTLMTR